MLHLQVFKQDKILDLMDLLPTSREENAERLEHTLKYGFLIPLYEYGELKAAAECYKLLRMPEYPVSWPYSVPAGQILYCFSAVAKKGFIKKLIRLGEQRFPECLYISWHDEKKNHKAFKLRINR